MAQFTALDPSAEVNGTMIQAMQAGMADDVEPLLRQHGITSTGADDWYPQQDWLNVLKAIHDKQGMAIFDLISIGLQVPDYVTWPAGIDSIEAALTGLDAAFHQAHRGGEVGHYRAEKISPGHIRLRVDSAYPSVFDYGILYRTAQRFMESSLIFTVTWAASPRRLQGDDHCLYDVIWKPRSAGRIRNE